MWYPKRDRAPSWRQKRWPQPVNEAQVLSEQRSCDGDFRLLESDVATVAHELAADLDELLPKYCQRPVFDLLQRQSAQKVAAITGERRELKPDLVVAETMAA